jgi:hypothetical protein
MKRLKINESQRNAAKIHSSIDIMTGLTNLLNSDILKLKKKNQEERRMLAKMKSDKSMIKYLK